MFLNKELLCLTKGARGILALRILGEILLNGFTLLRAYLIASLLSELVLTFHIENLWKEITGVLVIIFIEFLLINWNMRNSSVCGLKIKSAIREELLDCILDLGPSYLNKQRTGDIVSSLVSKIEAIEPYYTAYLPNGLSTVFWAIVVISYLTTVNLFVGLTCFIGILIVLLAPNIWDRIMLQFGQEDWTLMAQFKAEIMDNLQGMTTLKTFNQSNCRRERICKLAWEIHEKTMKHLSITQIESGVLVFGAYLGSSMSVAVAISQSLSGNIPSSQLILILFLISSCFAPAFSLIETWHLGYHGMAASPSIFSLLHNARRKREENHKTVVQGNKYENPVEISFQNLSFAYQEGQTVLNDITLTIPKSKAVALVGKSGSGKSTIINLITGFYHPNHGEISVDNSPLAINQLRDIMGIVWQEPYLFYGTIGDNICLGLENISKEYMVTAAKMGNIHDFIQTLSDGYDTFVGEGGLRLSGGEKQRLAITRCFLRNPKVLIFDEATSNLDVENEEKIKNSMETLFQGRTSLIITHRLSTIENTDLVYVLEQGKVVQQGSPKELAEKEGVFRQLLEKQVVLS